MHLIKYLSISDRYTKMYLDRRLAPLGLNSSQHMYVLAVCREPGITQDRFLTLFNIHPSNITRSIASLEKEGFLTRRMNEKDRRTCCLYPSEKAMKTAGKIEAICGEWEELLLEGISEEEKQLLENMLQRAGERAVELWKNLNETG